VTSEVIVQAGHVLASLVLAILILAAYRWVRSQSPLVAGLMAFGIVARAAIGLTLFWISYLDMPLLRELHLGDGFWELAVDARTYYQAAALAYFDGLSTIPAETPSAGFVRTLATWMRLVGVSPASGLFLNLSLYALLCLLVVAVCRPAANRQAQLACLVCLAPLSVAPALLIHGTQPLKDEAFVFFSAIACLSILTLLRAPGEAGARALHWPIEVAALGSLGVAAYAIAGIRLYFAALVLASLALATLVFAWRARATYLGRAVTTGAVCLAIASAGPVWVWQQTRQPTSAPQPSAANGSPLAAGRLNHRSTVPVGSLSPVDLWNSALARVRTARYRFALSGGGSNVVPVPAADDRLVGPTLVGLSVMFVPISIVRSLGWADFDGGHGLLFVTDIDTVLLDLSIVASLALLVVRRQVIGDRIAYVWYVLALAVVTSVLLAFVVTNFGTLFRLRLMMAVPIWMLPLAAFHRLEASRALDRDASESERAEPVTMRRSRLA
jgi:hypothetical protein